MGESDCIGEELPKGRAYFLYSEEDEVMESLTPEEHRSFKSRIKSPEVVSPYDVNLVPPGFQLIEHVWESEEGPLGSSSKGISKMVALTKEEFHRFLKEVEEGYE